MKYISRLRFLPRFDGMYLLVVRTKRVLKMKIPSAVAIQSNFTRKMEEKEFKCELIWDRISAIVWII